jgi:delta 1-pyrroline-5-carboxylate dehydrogenase
VGNLYINLNLHITGAWVGLHPFGGSSMRGAGSKAGGPDYLLQFLEPRVVTECLTDIDGDLVGSLYSARAASAKIDACVR